MLVFILIWFSKQSSVRGIPVIPCFRYGSWRSERLGNLLEAAQLFCGRTGLGARQPTSRTGLLAHCGGHDCPSSLCCLHPRCPCATHVWRSNSKATIFVKTSLPPPFSKPLWTSTEPHLSSSLPCPTHLFLHAMDTPLVPFKPLASHSVHLHAACVSLQQWGNAH